MLDKHSWKVIQHFITLQIRNVSATHNGMIILPSGMIAVLSEWTDLEMQHQLSARPKKKVSTRALALKINLEIAGARPFES